MVQAHPAVSDLSAAEFFAWVGFLCRSQPLFETV